jgi:hypothetical protein
VPHHPATDDHSNTTAVCVHINCRNAIVRGVPHSEDPLAGEPFSFLARADGSIVIRYNAAPVTILRGKAAARFMTLISGADTAGAQQLMARATGNFKRGNERVPPR